MSDREHRAAIRALKARVTQLEGLVADLMGVEALPDAGPEIISPEALRVIEGGEPEPDPQKTIYSMVHEGFGRWVIMADGSRMDLIGDHPKNPEGGPHRWWTKEEAEKMIAALAEDQETGGDTAAVVQEAALHPAQVNNAVEGDEAPNHPRVPEFKAKHQGGGRFVILKDGEMMDRLIGDHPKSRGMDEEGDGPQHYFTKEGAADMVEQLIDEHSPEEEAA